MAKPVHVLVLEDSAKDAVTTVLIGADEIRFSSLSTHLSSGRRVVCGFVTFRQPVYLPPRTERL